MTTRLVWGRICHDLNPRNSRVHCVNKWGVLGKKEGLFMKHKTVIRNLRTLPPCVPVSNNQKCLNLTHTDTVEQLPHLWLSVDRKQMFCCKTNDRDQPKPGVI